jgi:hypothetical protein
MLQRLHATEPPRLLSARRKQRPLLPPRASRPQPLNPLRLPIRPNAPPR